MDTSLPEVALIAALEREVRALVKEWRAAERRHDRRNFKVYEKGTAILICGGIGGEAARRAAEAAVALYRPRRLLSVGFAGALDQQLKIGQVFWPRVVIDAKDGSRIETDSAQGTLVSYPEVIGAEQKAKLAAAYGAQAVDMEAAAVARTARIHGVAFAAVKAISDEASFQMPDISRFVTQEGGFRSAAFVGHAMARPWLWANVVRLMRNSNRASRALCGELELYLEAIS